ncbi:DUF1080 domain-containing protein [Flavihumibacter rivuli]|uniref:3-keto-disaccharide hydrolase n=1 Tax=Flavihumibacter rivuli TaxID=2838156 RepID=UPI001BDF15DE|nr:DUF1080 domain-containing protein [Flavihumibacter rivuli]ULQ55082.1 DUF1080 domain-containing protein [Flavihumibacter rivuli]
MNRYLFILTIALGMTASSHAQQQGDPKATEVWTPVPKVVDPGNTSKAPSDAIVLFDGKNLDQWVSAKDGGKAGWTIENGVLTVKAGAGDIKTKDVFGDCQLHIEWRTPAKVESEGQGRGNSGIFFMQQYELQVLDSYNNQTYSNGQAGSLYKQHMPLVNACRPPGEWQTYDVIFTAPKFKEDGSLLSPARVTVLHNNVLIQNNVELKGKTLYIGQPFYEKHGPGSIQLQDHGNPVSYRNIWLRKL